MNEIVKIQGMYKSFFGAKALDGMDFTIYEGEIHCLIGENGCGKSTMIKIISGFHPFDKGDLYINSKKFGKITPIEAMKEGIQVIYQDFSLIPNMTIAENITMYNDVYQNRMFVNRNKMRKMARATVKKVNFDIDIDKYVYELGVAQKQMVAICRAMALDAKLIIMDEPTTALTSKEVENLFKLVFKLKENGVSILFVSHKLDEVLKIADSITVMRNGKSVYNSRGDKISKEEMVYYMTGKKFSEERYSYIQADNNPLLKVKNYSLKNKFSDISFSLYRGEILGLTGLLGCGRNEVAKSLFGLIPATNGSVEINNEDIGIIKNVGHALKYNIGYVPEDRLTEGLHMEQSIADNGISRIIGSLVDKNGLLNMKKVQEKKKEILSLIYIPQLKPNNPARSLSGGNQQKVVLAKWLAAQPKIFILNSPTVGVDVGSKTEIHNIVKKLASKGVGIILISDDIPELMALCNRVLIMNEGHIINEKIIMDTSMEELSELIAINYKEVGKAI
jgi:simple sugar transport system ATP-binding protein